MEMVLNGKRSTADDVAQRPDDDHQHLCGWACWRPKFLQQLATPKSFLLWLSLAVGCQSFLINGLVNVVVSTIERRYELTSTDSGIIVGAFDIASFISVLPISYLGGRKGACKPRWIGCGVLLLGLGSFLFCVPHFAVGLYQAQAEQQVSGTCSPHNGVLPPRNESCSSADGHQASGFTLRSFRHIFFIAQFIMGVGGAPLYTLGPTFIDDSVTHKMQPIYSGIVMASALFGPALGFIAGGQLLRIYVDFPVVMAKEVGITPSSSVWVGAWWIGFLLIGVVLFITAIPMLAFPAELPGTKELAAAKEAEARQSNADLDPENEDIPKSYSDEDVSIGQSLREFPQALRDLLRIWSYLFVCLEHACEALILAGFGAFIPKIIESQFSLTSATSALIVGALIIPCGSGGSFFGGYIIKRLKLRTPAILKLSTVFVGLSFIFSLGFMIYCPNTDFPGLTVPYHSDRSNGTLPQQGLSFNSGCNSNCSCSLAVFNPVCGVDNMLYYSPCHAGCVQSHQYRFENKSFRPTTVYSECSCITHTNGSDVDLLNGGKLEGVDVMAIRQKCASPCTYQLYLFVAMVFGLLLAQFLNSMPLLSATLRIVPPSRRAFALGLQMIIWRLLGAIPGPVVFGAFIDNACLLWKPSESVCEEDSSGSCVVYDNYSFSRAMVGLMLIGKALSFLFAFLASWLCRTPTSVLPSSPDGTGSVPTPHSMELSPSNKGNQGRFAYDNSAMEPVRE